MTTVTLSEFIFLNITLQIYILFLVSYLKITYEVFVVHLCAIYFIGCCFVFGVRVGWNTVKRFKNE